MMNTQQIVASLEQTIGDYIRDLDGYREEDFLANPSETNWSLGQMYVHLLGAAFYMQLRNVELCKSEDAQTSEGKTDVGQMIFEQGSMPNVDIKVPPSAQYTPANPQSKAEVREQLLRLVDELKRVELTLQAVPQDRKVAHPRFGYLNAAEWFALIEMHFRHHLRQKAKIEKNLGLQAS